MVEFFHDTTVRPGIPDRDVASTEIPTEQEQLKVEIQHIFDSGANEIRILEMVKSFINSREPHKKIALEDAYDKGFKDAMIKYRKD